MEEVENFYLKVQAELTNIQDSRILINHADQFVALSEREEV